MWWWEYILIDFPSIIISFYPRGYDTALKPFRFSARQTDRQTKFIQQKYIQVPYQVYMSFLEIQITL